MAGSIALTAGCAVAPDESAKGGEQVTNTERGVSTCITIQNTITPVITTAVDDAQLVTDVTDPTKANTSYGSIQQMNTGYNGTGYQRLLFRFDLTGAGVPAGATIDSATLKIRMIQSLGKANVDVYAATALWNEASVTWNSYAASPGGGLGALQTSIVTLGVSNNSTLSVPLAAALVQTWATPATNYGLVFDHPSSGRTTIGSSEAPSVGPRPKLDICYSNTPATCSDGLQNQGELGIDCGGPCAQGCGHPPATEAVSGGTKSRSTHYKAVYTIGQPTQDQGTGTSTNYRVQDGLIGANGSLP